MNCLKCNNPFPIRIMIDGRERNLQHRKYCLECSPFGQHNTRKIDGMSATPKCCKMCKKPLKSRRRNFCNSCNVVKQRQRNKQRLVEYKGGKCELCGYNKCSYSLHFHHRDPNEKEFGITSQCKSLKCLKVEVDKCSLLCANCHGEVHSGLVNIPL